MLGGRRKNHVCEQGRQESLSFCQSKRWLIAIACRPRPVPGEFPSHGLECCSWCEWRGARGLRLSWPAAFNQTHVQNMCNMLQEHTSGLMTEHVTHVFHFEYMGHRKGKTSLENLQKIPVMSPDVFSVAHFLDCQRQDQMTSLIRVAQFGREPEYCVEYWCAVLQAALRTSSRDRCPSL